MSEKLFFNIFRKKDLMSYAQMKVLFYKDCPNKKAEAVGANLRKNCLMVSKFIQASCECFSEDQMDYIQKSKKIQLSHHQ